MPDIRHHMASLGRNELKKTWYFCILPHHSYGVGSCHHSSRQTWQHPCFVYSRYHGLCSGLTNRRAKVRYMYDIYDICHTFPLPWQGTLVSNCSPWIARSADDICQSWDGTFMLLVFLCQKNIVTANQSWYHESERQCYQTFQFDERWWLGGL